MAERILVVAAHPDDEVLGIGGTVLRHAKKGDEVYCLIMATGVDARNAKGKSSASEINKLKAQTEKAARILGYKATFFANLPDNRMDSVDLLDIVKKVEKIIEKIKPSTVYTHHANDLNVDHRLCFEAVITASRPIGENRIKKVYTFETLSSSEWQAKTDGQFAPNSYIDISGEIEDKMRALKEYASEMREYPHSRSAEGVKILAQYRGLESGLRFAEALSLIKEISF